MGEVPAIAVGHCRQVPLAVFAGFQGDLRNAREILAERVLILRDRRAQPVKPHLLVEIGVGGRAFPFMRIARIEDARPGRRPCRAAAAGGELHARDFIGQHPAGINLEEVQRALLAAALGQRHRDQPPIGRGRVPVHGRRAVRVIGIGIEHRPPQGRRFERGKAHQHRLLGRRFEPQGKDPPLPLLQIKIARRLFAAQLHELLRNPIAERQPGEIRARPLILQSRPLAHCRGGRFLQPLVIVHDRYPVKGIGGGLARGRHGGERDSGGEQRRQCEEESRRVQTASGSAGWLVHNRTVSSEMPGGKAFGFIRQVGSMASG